MSQIASDDVPYSFICCGENDGTTRSQPQDRYRLCVRGCSGKDDIDEMSDGDVRDFTHQVAVMSRALAIIAEEGDQ